METTRLIQQGRDVWRTDSKRTGMNVQNTDMGMDIHLQKRPGNK